MSDSIKMLDSKLWMWSVVLTYMKLFQLVSKSVFEQQTHLWKKIYGEKAPMFIVITTKKKYS